MSREIRCTYQGAATLYAVIRRISDEYVWNGTTFEAWADGNIATYDVALTNRSGDVYDADWPSTMAAGDYRVNLYEQAGAAPATTDLLLSTFEKHWDGYQATTTSTITLSAYALCTLDNLKTYMGITDSSKDTVLTLLINSVTAYIEQVCARHFKARDYKQRYSGEYQRSLVLREYPIITIRRIAYGYQDAFTVKYTGGIMASASITPTSLHLMYYDSGGTKTDADYTFTDYPTVSSLVTKVNTLTGWTAELKSNQPSDTLNPTASTDALNLTVTFTYPDLADALYDANYDRGVVEFSREWWQAWSATSGVWGFWGGTAWGEPRGAMNRDYQRRFPRVMAGILVDYRAGYETVPDDVAMLCMEMVQEKYAISLRKDPGEKSSTLGPYSVSYGPRDWETVRTRLALYLSSNALIAGVV